VNTYFINDIQETGFYILGVESKEFLSPSTRRSILDNPAPNCVLIVYNFDNIEIETSVNTYLLKVGNDVGLYAQILKDGKNAIQLLQDGENVVVSHADMWVEAPNGNEIDVPMHDDGLYGDKIRGDHIYSATVPTLTPGTYRLSAVLKGFITDEAGNQKPFLKTAEHSFIVSAKSVEIKDHAWLTYVDNHLANIHIAVNLDKGVKLSDNLGDFRAYTEVYGVAKDGSIQPATWLGGGVNVETDDKGNLFFTLELNMHWLANSNVKGPLTLKNTYLANGNTQYPVTIFEDEIVVQSSKVQENPNFKKVLSLVGPLTITEEMKFGVNPLPKPINGTAGPTLFLVHGYCSDTNPFLKHGSQFTGASFYLDANKNVNNHQFSIGVHNFAQSQGSSLYSIIGHSQGGLVGLHLLNEFWSGLDHVSSGRRIQTIGTPWKGNSAAGSSANLGKLFGIGCGQNNDLTLDGARNWFAGIHEDHPQYVYYFTSTYKQGNLFGDYCNMAINSILQWPNDGVSETKYSSLPGGKNMGNTEKQCHTTGMKYGPQYYDTTRNAQMNANAGRS